jgi:hypothetical protein
MPRQLVLQSGHLLLQQRCLQYVPERRGQHEFLLKQHALRCFLELLEQFLPVDLRLVVRAGSVYLQRRVRQQADRPQQLRHLRQLLRQKQPLFRGSMRL